MPWSGFLSSYSDSIGPLLANDSSADGLHVAISPPIYSERLCEPNERRRQYDQSDHGSNALGSQQSSSLTGASGQTRRGQVLDPRLLNWFADRASSAP